MKQSNKEAKFFCESCGNEVPRKSRFCPACGKFFASVRCPECGKTGSPEDFKAGCPRCGHAVDGKHGKHNAAAGLDMKLITGTNSGGKNKTFNGIESGAPIWAYVVSIGVLAVLVVMLYSCL